MAILEQVSISSLNEVERRMVRREKEAWHPGDSRTVEVEVETLRALLEAARDEASGEIEKLRSKVRRISGDAEELTRQLKAISEKVGKL